MSGLTGLKEPALKLILFGGKGGVGKTTCASSTALYLAGEFKTLLISTDPAHSVSDSLEQEIGPDITKVKGGPYGTYAGGEGVITRVRAVENLSALEINAEKALADFKVQYGSQIRGILDTSSNLDEEDIDSLFDLSVPGLDELMGLKTILDVVEEGKFEKYVVDTAPTGHTLRLLTMPRLLDEWIKALARLRWKYRYMVERFRGKYTPDNGDDFLLAMKKTVKRLEELLRDRDRCQFIVVTIPEQMAVAEAGRMLAHLDSCGLKVSQMVMNNVMEARDCRFCAERRAEQEKYLVAASVGFGNLRIVNTYLQSKEIKGIAALNHFSEMLFQWQQTKITTPAH